MRQAEEIRRWETWVPRTIGIVAVVSSLLLAAMLWLIHLSVEREAMALAQGQASRLFEAVHQFVRTQRQPPHTLDWGEFLAGRWDQGLRYIAFMPHGPQIDIQAGEPLTPLDREALDSLRPAHPVPIGDRVRVYMGPRTPPDPGPGPVLHEMDPLRRPDGRHMPPPPRFGNPGGPLAPGLTGSPPGPGQGPGGPPSGAPGILVEFVPIAANRLRSQVGWALLVGSVGVPLYLGGAFLLAYLVRQRERLTRRLEHERRLAALGEMSAVIAHEIRNPLASLKGHAQLLRESLESDPRSAKVDRVVNDAVRLERLISDLLDFSRSGSLDPMPTSPADLLRRCAEAVDPARIIMHTDGGPKEWTLDPSHMHQALTNILRNAVQVTPDGTSVEASLACEGGSLIFEVRDRGPGIEPGDEERVFEPFYTKKTRGTGLGLALVKRIVTQHGGTVAAFNHADGGAVFRIMLPGSL